MQSLELIKDINSTINVDDLIDDEISHSIGFLYLASQFGTDSEKSTATLFRNLTTDIRTKFIWNKLKLNKKRLTVDDYEELLNALNSLVDNINVARIFLQDTPGILHVSIAGFNDNIRAIRCAVKHITNYEGV